MIIQNYVKPANLEEAYALLVKSKGNRLLGGGTFLKRTHLRVANAIDLSDCGLDYLKKEKDGLHIGAYTSLRKLETSEEVLTQCGNVLKDPLSHLIGVQLRNQITIGGHVAPRFGFSDIIPALMILDAKLEFYHRGEISLISYMEEEKPEKDILTEIFIPEEGRKGKMQSMRISYNDYSVFGLGVSRCKNSWIIAAGNFPGRAKCASAVMKETEGRKVTKKDAGMLSGKIAESFVYGSNYRGSAEYRKELCRVFARRAIEELADEN